MRLCRGIGPGARPGTWDVLTRTRSHAVLVLACLLSGLVAGCYETQPPDPVTGLSCRAKPTKVDLVWDPAPRAVAYQVERSGGKITFIDTGLESSIGERLWRVRHLVQDDEMFIANYSDGLTDLYLPSLESRVRNTDAVGGFMTVRPPVSFHAVDSQPDGRVSRVRAITGTDLRINGGYFVFKSELFDYMREGEELVMEPFQRLIEAGRLTSMPYDGFWMSMDTFKEKQQLDDMYARGVRPWQVWRRPEDTILASEGGQRFSA